MKLYHSLFSRLNTKVFSVDRRVLPSVNNILNRKMSGPPRNYFELHGLLKPGHYNLQVGAPNPKDLKKLASLLQKATVQCNEIDKRFEETLQYGTVPGDQVVCDQFAKFLTRQYGQPVDKDNLFITAGASLGLVVLIRHYLNPNQTIFLENPTYPVVAQKMNTDNLAKAVPIEMQSDGMDLDMLEEKLKLLPDVELTSRFPFRAAVYVIPIHHNPSGCCYSPEKCRRLVKLARKYNLLVISDDIYNSLNYVTKKDDPTKFETPPQRLFMYDDPTDEGYQGNVVSNGSLSKIIAPGLRLGWYEAPQHVIKSLLATYIVISGGGSNPYVSNLTAQVMSTGEIDDHVQHLRVAHKERMETVISMVESKLGKFGVKISHPAGGYFLWLEMPKHVTAAEVHKVSAEKEKITFVDGNKASVVGDFPNFIRLCIAFYDVEDLKKATEGLCRSIESVILSKNVSPRDVGKGVSRL